jgi:hypothetical protein
MNLRILTSPKVVQPNSGLKQPPMALIEGMNSSSHIGSRFYTTWTHYGRRTKPYLSVRF